MDFIKIARLKSGEDIICFVEFGKNVARIIYPVTFFMSYNEEEDQEDLNLSFWLPKDLMEKNQVTIPITEFLFFTKPNKNFMEFYLNYLTLHEEEMEESDYNEIKNLLETFDVPVNKLH